MPEITDPSILAKLNSGASGAPARTPGGGVILVDPLQASQESRAQAGEARDAARLGLSFSGEERSQRSEARSGVQSLRKEFDGLEPVKNYKSVMPLYSSALKTPADKGGDLSLVYYFAKIMDPQTGVREGEMANIQNTDTRLDSISQRFLTELRGSGGMFTDKARQNVRNALRIAVEDRKRAYDLERAQFEQVATESGYRPEMVVGKRADEPFQKSIDDYWKKTFETAKSAPPPLELSAGPTYSTDRDLEITQRAQGIWDNGGTVEDINAFFQSQGLPPMSEQDAATLRALPPGSPAVFRAPQSGQRTQGEQMFAEVAQGPVGAFGVGAANAATLGLLDELAPIVGMDAARVQQGKEALREANPISSFAGELAGGVAGMAPASMLTRRLLPGLGEGAGAIAADALYGAGYGAGESNEDRLKGGLAGGAAGAAGGAIARRLGGGDVPPTAPEPMAPMTPPAGTPPVSQAVGQVAPPVAAPMASVAQAMPTPPVAQAAPPVPAGMAPVEPVQLGQMISLASGTGARANAARTKLAEMAQVDPEAMRAAERLGIEVPADVFADNPQIREAIGLTRAVGGSDASAEWATAVQGAVDRADEIMREFDARFVEGAVAPGSVSDTIKTRLLGESKALQRNADALYRKVDEAIPMQTPVQMTNSARVLGEIASEVGPDGLSAAERQLQKVVESGNLTYGRLRREKNLMRQAMERKESPYGNMDHSALKRLYDAISTDQLDNVGQIGGEEMRKELRGANLMWAKRAGLNKRIVNAFGEDEAGSIAEKMRAAITRGAKGETGELTRLLKTVPEDLRRETVATALASATRSNQGAMRGGFGFSEFASLYPKLRANPQTYKQVIEALGPDSAARLNDLYKVSKRITDARASIPTTGKANQALLMGMRTEGLVKRIMGSTAGRRAADMAMGAAGGPIMGAAAGDLTNFLAARPDAREAAGKLFSSPEFQNLLVASATKAQVPDPVIAKVAGSRPFVAIADKLGVPKTFRDRANWLRQALTLASVQAAQPEPTNAQPGTVIRIGGQ